MSLFEKGELLFEKIFDATSKNISYYRDEVKIASEIPAKLGRTVFRTNDAAGLSIRYEDRDFIIKHSDIKLVFPPEKGDMIEFDSFLYQVS